MSAEERARLRVRVTKRENLTPDEVAGLVDGLEDEIDRLTEALEAAEWENEASIDGRMLRALERAEAELADEKRRHGKLRAGVEALAARAEKFAYMEPSGMGLANELRALLSDTTTCACGGTGSGCRCERETLSDTTIGEPT